MEIFTADKRLKHLQFEDRLIHYLSDHLALNITVKDLAKFIHVSNTSLNQLFKTYYHETPIRWLWKIRTYICAELIASNPEAALMSMAGPCGFSSKEHFSRKFKDIFHLTPSEYRQSYKITSIFFPRLGERATKADNSVIAKAIKTLSELTISP